MNYCKKCKEVFEDNEIIYIRKYYEDDLGIGNDFSYKTAYTEGACPYCNSTQIVEAKLCEECEEYKPAEEFEKENICVKCDVNNIKSV